MEGVKKHEAIRALSPEEEFILDYVETDDANGSLICKKEVIDTKENENILNQEISPLPIASPDSRTPLNDIVGLEFQSPDAAAEDVDNNLKINLLNGELLDEEIENLSKDNHYPKNHRNENDALRERRRPRTPLSPCPDTADELEAEEENASLMEHSVLDGVDEESQREKRSLRRNNEVDYTDDRRTYSHSERHSSSQRRRIVRPLLPKRDDLPRAYSGRKDRRGGRLVRLKQLVFRGKADPRLLLNRRNRILRLREAAERRRLPNTRSVSVGRRALPRSELSMPLVRRGNNQWVSSTLGRRGADINFNLEEYMSRRNPSYYPPQRSRSPPSRHSRAVDRRGSIPPLLALPSRRYSPQPRRLPPRPVERRIPYNLNSSCPRRSRSPREPAPYRALPPARLHHRPMPSSSTSLSMSRYYNNSNRYRNDYSLSQTSFPSSSTVPAHSSSSRRRSPPVYEGGVRVSSSATSSNRYRQSFPPPPPFRNINRFNNRRGNRFQSQRPLKIWRCPAREPSPVE